jgi:hypothetical protein
MSKSNYYTENKLQMDDTLLGLKSSIQFNQTSSTVALSQKSRFLKTEDPNYCENKFLRDFIPKCITAYKPKINPSMLIEPVSTECPSGPSGIPCVENRKAMFKAYASSALEQSGMKKEEYEPIITKCFADASPTVSGSTYKQGFVCSASPNGCDCFVTMCNDDKSCSPFTIEGCKKCQDTCGLSSSCNGNNYFLAPETISGATVSNDTVSGATVSGATVSGATVSNDTVSNDTVSNDTVSNDTVSNDTVSGATTNDTNETYMYVAIGVLSVLILGGIGYAIYISNKKEKPTFPTYIEMTKI